MCIICIDLEKNKLTPWEAAKNRKEMISQFDEEHLKVLDESTQTNLKNEYKVKMNKGYLLTSFDFRFASSSGDKHLAENNTMYFYRSGQRLGF